VREPEGRFWSFSLTTYNKPGVQKESLDLQDEHGIDVNMLLFCAFVGGEHRAVLPEADLKAALEVVADWHKNVVSRLRQVRRALKPLAADQIHVRLPAESLRTAVKTAEVEAERIEQAMLESWIATRIDGWRRAAPEEAVPANIHNLFVICCNSARQPPLPFSLIGAAVAVAPAAGNERHTDR
jgi:uncharacterized protein (TIGR02444 family)